MYWVTAVFSLFCFRASLSIHSFPLPLFFPVDLCVLLPTSLFHSTSFSCLLILCSPSVPLSVSVWSLYSFLLSQAHESPPIQSFPVWFSSLYIFVLVLIPAPTAPIHISDNCGAVWSSVVLIRPCPCCVCNTHMHYMHHMHRPALAALIT